MNYTEIGLQGNNSLYSLLAEAEISPQNKYEQREASRASGQDGEMWQAGGKRNSLRSTSAGVPT